MGTFFNKNKSSIIVFIIIAVVAVFIIFSNYGIVKRIQLEIGKKTLMKDIKKEKDISDSLSRQIKLLETDKLEIERIAREKYGMLKPGEKVFIKKTNWNAIEFK